jgi:hypothetical protein
MPTDFAAEVGRTFTPDANPTFGVIAARVLEVEAQRLPRRRGSA